MSNSAWWAWAFKNSVNIICWVVLAIVFNKWWIALFAGLFVSWFQTSEKKYYRVCDNCGRHSPYVNTYNEAIEAAEKEGWVHIPKDDTDYCPHCQRIMER